MEEIQSIFQFGQYTYYVWTAVITSLTVLVILFWRSQRQLTKQKQVLKRSQKKYES